jgi:hypothetical protein
VVHHFFLAFRPKSCWCGFFKIVTENTLHITAFSQKLSPDSLRLPIYGLQKRRWNWHFSVAMTTFLAIRHPLNRVNTIPDTISAPERSITIKPVPGSFAVIWFLESAQASSFAIASARYSIRHLLDCSFNVRVNVRECDDYR